MSEERSNLPLVEVQVEILHGNFSIWIDFVHVLYGHTWQSVRIETDDTIQQLITDLEGDELVPPHSVLAAPPSGYQDLSHSEQTVRVHPSSRIWSRRSTKA